VEERDLQRRIERMQAEIEDMPKHGKKDIVKGGAGGRKTFSVSASDREYSRRKTAMMQLQMRMLCIHEDLAQKMQDIEETIEHIESPKIRAILRMRCMDGKSWKEIAKEFGEGYTEDAVRKEYERYMKHL
jgi:hypothetical protein